MALERRGWNPDGAIGLLETEVPAVAIGPPEPSDGELIARSCSDPHLFVGIFERHFAVVHGYLARRAGAALAEELAAETFTIAFAKRARYRPETPDARPWLFGIAFNLLRTQRRRERRELRAYARTGVDPLSGADDATFEDARRNAAARELAAALAQLGQNDREILLLFFWGDLTYEEIAVALSIPVGTVRSRLNRARTRLRELLDGTGHLGTRARPAVAPTREART